jgi:formylglycine-generating enzyme required for sulfatase activity
MQQIPDRGITLDAIHGDYSSPDYISRVLDKSSFISTLVSEKWAINPNLEIEEDETEDQILKKLYSIAEWNQSSNIEKQKAFKIILDRLNDESSDWKFIGVLNQDSSFSAKIDCSRCNIVEKTKRYGCKFCINTKLEITVNSDETMTIVTCQNKDCGQTYENFIPLNGKNLDGNVQHKEQHVYLDVCMECQGNKNYNKLFKTRNSIGVFEHIPTKIIFNLIPGNKGLDHKQVYHNHGEAIHFCNYPEQSCCCYIGVERNPFFISKTPVTWKQATDANPNVMGFGNIYNFNIKNIYFASQNDIPATNLQKNQTSDWLKCHGLRLPTIGEWNYATRGSSATAYPWGNKLDTNSVSNILSSDNPKSYIAIPDNKQQLKSKTSIHPDFMTDGLTEDELRGFGVEMAEMAEMAEGFLKEESGSVLSIQSAIKSQTSCNGFGLSDMLGNVKEYTSTYIVGGSVFDPISRYPHPSDQYVLNGNHSVADIGFRAAISIPGITEQPKEQDSNSQNLEPGKDPSAPLTIAEVERRAFAELHRSINDYVHLGFNKVLKDGSNHRTDPKHWAEKAYGLLKQKGKEAIISSHFNILSWLSSIEIEELPNFPWFDHAMKALREWTALELSGEYAKITFTNHGRTTESLEEWLSAGLHKLMDCDVWAEKAITYLTEQGKDALMDIEEENQVAIIPWLKKAGVNLTSFTNVLTNEMSKRWVTKAAEALQDLIADED